MSNENQENSQVEQEPKKRRGLISRRRFLGLGAIALGGTVAAVYFGRTTIRREIHHTMATSEGGSHAIQNFEPFAFFEMQPDNKLMVNVSYAEMGQGIVTGFAMLAAEELDLSMDQVLVRPNPYDALIDNGATGGSGTTRTMYKPIREIAATFREMLKIAVAKQWGVELASVQTANGILSANGQEMSYIDAVNSTTEWEIPDPPPELRPRSAFRVVGSEQRRPDLKPKVMGEAVYALDYERPDMLYANLLKCPYIGGTLEEMDIAAAKAVPGVLEVIQDVVRGDEMVAVVAENRYAAEMGKRALNAQWHVPKRWQQSDIDQLTTVGAPDTFPVNLQREGRAVRILNGEGDKLVSAEYRVATGVHAHMEPNSAIADVQGDHAFIVTGSQGAYFEGLNVANALDIPAENVDVQNAYLGGGFGRRVALNPAAEAAVISRKMGRPIQIVWDRETEFLCGLVRPPTHHAFRAKLNNAGRVTAIEHELASGSQIINILGEMVPFNEPLHALLGADLMSASHGATFMYDFENRETNIWHIDLPFNVGIWRGVGMYPNGFAVESFVDEVAHAAGQDPFDFRMAHINNTDPQSKRYREVLKRLRAESGWDEPKPAGVGRGLAIIDDRLTVCAAVIEVEVVDDSINVLKVTHVTDPGIVVNPDGVRQQVEGCIMMGLSASLYEETLVKDSHFTASNYHTYPMALLLDTPPEINIILMEGSDKISGIGEPPIGPIAPAIANAIFDASGQRLREIPFQKALEMENA